MSYSVKTKYKGNMAFDGDIDGHIVRMDATPQVGGENTGPSPKKLLLASLAGCTGMDIVSLLNKMRIEFSDYEMETSATLTEDHPVVFDQITIVYRIKVAEKDQKKVEKAVKLSKDKYCGVSAMLEKNSPIEFRIEFI